LHPEVETDFACKYGMRT